MECLSGVCDAKASAQVLGVSEVFGCLFGMLGSYLGAALLEDGVWAPFGLCTVWSALSVTFLLFSLGLRTWARESGCDKSPCFQGAIGSVPLCLAGLSTIAQCRGSYVKDERAFRHSQSQCVLGSDKEEVASLRSKSHDAFTLGRSKSHASLAPCLLQGLLQAEEEKVVCVV